MKQTFKYIGLLALLPLALVVLTPDLIGEADAKKAEGSGIPSKSYGSATSHIVCGDQLCSEIDNDQNQS